MIEDGKVKKLEGRSGSGDRASNRNAKACPCRNAVTLAAPAHNALKSMESARDILRLCFKS